MMDLIDRAALLRTFDTVQKSDPMADNGRGYDDHFINADGEPSTEWFCVEDYVLKMPTIPAVPLGPLCEWLGEHHAYYSYFVMDRFAWRKVLTKWMEGLYAKTD